MKLKIAFLQLVPDVNIEDNIEKGIKACREAELILVPNACPMEINRLSQLRGRAYENMLAIATCNYPVLHCGCNGHSTLFDGVIYNKHGNSNLLWRLDKDSLANQSAIFLIIRASDICWNQVVCKRMAGNKGILLKSRQ